MKIGKNKVQNNNNFLLLKDIKTIYGFDKNLNFFEQHNKNILIKNEKILGIGQDKDELIKKNIKSKNNIDSKPLKIVNCSGLILTPSFVDPHTHLIFGGTREDEFFLRNKGVSYLEIAKHGGGISSTVKATRNTSSEILLKNLLKRIKLLSSFGVTHIEIKSGYGLTTKEEIRLLEIINKAKEYTNIKIYPTLLAAHDFPPESKHDNKLKQKYIDEIVNEIIPETISKNLAIFFDIFSEEKVYNLNQTRYLLEEAKSKGFKLKLHSDELSNIGATELGVEMNAVSVDHLLKISESGIKKLKNSKTTPVLLPGTAFYLNEPFPDFKKFMKYGVEVAIASDCNPGSNYTENMLFIYTLASLKLGMDEKQILKAATINASSALDLKPESGTGIIDVGYSANFNLFEAPNLKYIFYHYGINPIFKTFIDGEETWVNQIT